jgi:hypothetical protein
MMVKRNVRACHIRQVGGDITVGDINLAVLHVLGVDKLDIVDQVQFIEQYGAYQAIKITAGNESEFLGRHGAVSAKGWGLKKPF